MASDFGESDRQSVTLDLPCRREVFVRLETRLLVTLGAMLMLPLAGAEPKNKAIVNREAVWPLIQALSEKHGADIEDVESGPGPRLALA